jgi:subtilisin family serine protease
MKKTRRLLAVIMAIAMLISVIPAFAAGAEKAARPLTEREKSAKLTSLMSFYGRYHEMKEEIGSLYAKRDESDPYTTARIIVKFKGSLKDTGAIAEVSGHNDWHVLQYTSSEEARKACERFKLMKGVEYAVPDMIMKITATPGSNSFLSWGYGADHVDAYSYNEWLYAQAGNDLSNLPTITVAVIDTGAASDHPFIMNRLVPGYDFSDYDDDPEDEHYHGTHVSGTVVDGTFENVKIMPIRVLDSSGYGETVQVCAGMEYAYLNGCQVENLSLGGECDGLDGEEHLMMAEVIEAAFDNGTTVCVAAGNDSEDAQLFCPANVERAMTVASITSSHSLSWFSNYGAIVDIAAPGSDINSSVPGGGYNSLDGTSMATPHVSAAAAMVRSFYPDMSADSVVNVLKGAAVDIGLSNAGTGMLNVTDLFKFDIVINGEGQESHFVSTGSYPWQVEAGAAFSGNAGVNNSTSVLSARMPLAAYQAVTFEYKVSSQQGHDYLRVKAAGQTLFEASGEQDWQEATVIIPASGYVIVTWEFSKDSSGASGSDMAWIRNVRVAKTLSSVVNAAGSNVEFISNGNYNWVVDYDENAAKSGNAGVHSSTSVMTASVSAIAGMKLRFKYKVSSASGDNFTFSVNGATVLTSGATSDYVDYEYTVTTNGIQSLRFVFTKNASGSSGSDCAWVKGFSVGHTFMSAACGTSDPLDFVNNSAYPWVVEEDHVVSTNQGFPSTESYFTLTIDMTRGETLTFRYSVSSESNYDFFKFYVDGAQTISESGVVDWTNYTFTASSNKTYTFKWAYSKDYSVNRNDDCARVDDIIYSGNQGLLGDVNGDGSVSTTDALLILRYVNGLIGPNELNLTRADVDGDGSITSSDALLILRMNMNITA